MLKTAVNNDNNNNNTETLLLTRNAYQLQTLPEVNTARPVRTGCFLAGALSYLSRQHWSTLKTKMPDYHRHQLQLFLIL